MANEKQANEARRQHGRTLMRRGAHAVGVEEGKPYGKTGFVVVAHVAPGKKKKPEIPSEVVLASDDGEIEVPVVVERGEPFKLA